ncbi:MAG TPA: M56 family metallopeptidase [Acidobacteriaceae bacterium]|nr:M56 family metallopeptidase [Acidobacteriaceae bacterium]
MNPDLLLGIVTALASYVLKTTLAFAVCLLLSLLAGSAGRRFILWLGFLFGITAYWFWLIREAIFGSPVPLVSPGAETQSVAPSVGVFQIPPSWAFPLGVGLRILVVAYLLILAWLVVTQLRKLRQLRWILGFTSPPPPEIQRAFVPLASKLRVARSRLLVLAGASSPATFGWIRPTIVLPDVCLERDRSELEDILLHELHHVRRWDFLWNGLAVGCRTLLFFHPAAWYAVREMEFARELACDLAAVSDSPKRRVRYAECLIRFARMHSAQDARNWGIDFASSSRQLKARVHSILAGSRTSPVWLVCSRVACGFVVLAAFLSVEPSVGLLLTYARGQITQSAISSAATIPAKTVSRQRGARKIRVSASAAPVAEDNTVARLYVNVPVSDPAPDPNPAMSSMPASGGPQLLHRGSSSLASHGAQRTTVLINDASDQAGKADRDHKQALQQTATAAAGIYKRLSAFDRR